MSDPLDAPLPDPRNPHGWRPDDPMRPCYTCGAPPYGRYPNGSPAYSCGPHGSVTVMPPWPWPAPRETVYRLTDEEIALVMRLAEQMEAADAGGRMKFEPKGETRIAVKVRGLAGELAASHLTGLPWRFALVTDPRLFARRLKAPDIGQRTEVRTARRPDGRLRGYDNDRVEHAFLLMTGDPPVFTFRAAGWVEGRDFLLARNRDERYGGWSLGQAPLRPLPLPADA